MCDTVVALGNATKDGSVLFAKNSDRDPNEAHHLQVIPSADHEPGSMLQCTYFEIPQVEHTNRVLLAKPFWIWGAEMGANEYGVVIGNEAVFSKDPAGKEPGLIGMDFLRLALERGSSALDAMNVIITLLERYGQSGNCGFSHPFYYNNSYLIADHLDAWVLETVGRQWAAEQVKDVRSISNRLSIGSRWDMASADLVNYAVDCGWCKKREDFHFSRCYSDLIFTRFSDSRNRQVCSSSFLRQNLGDITPGMLMSLLRGHSMDKPDDWSPDRSLTGANICMHAGFGPIRINQTTGSLVSHIDTDLVTHWVTGTAAPCTSLFKPVWLDLGEIDFGPIPAGIFDPASLFWQHEKLHRQILMDYRARLPLISSDRDRLEQEWLQMYAFNTPVLRSSRISFVDQWFQRAYEQSAAWLEQVKGKSVVCPPSLYYRMAWNKFNKQAGMTI